METTIQVEKKLKDRLEGLKLHPRESYNKVIERLVDIRTDEGELSEETMLNIERGLEDVRKGRTFSTKEVKHKLGI
jgi:predicted transcriptional regulator